MRTTVKIAATVLSVLLILQLSEARAGDRLNKAIANSNNGYWQMQQSNAARNAARAARQQSYLQPSTRSGPSYYQRSPNGQGGTLYTPGRNYQVLPSANRTGYWIFGW